MKVLIFINYMLFKLNRYYKNKIFKFIITKNIKLFLKIKKIFKIYSIGSYLKQIILENEFLWSLSFNINLFKFEYVCIKVTISKFSP